jgi:hypothetical protein
LMVVRPSLSIGMMKLDGKQDDQQKSKMPMTVCPKSEFISLLRSATSTKNK